MRQQENTQDRLAKDDSIWVECELRDALFPEERCVTIQVDPEPQGGITDERFVKEKDGKFYVAALVIQSDDDSVLAAIKWEGLRDSNLRVPRDKVHRHVPLKT